MENKLEIEIEAHNLDCKIDAIKARFSEQFDEEDVEMLIQLSMKLGELYAQRDFNKKLEGCVVVPVRSDNEIIDQTIELMDLLATSTNRFQRDPDCLFPFESNNPRIKEWWYVACQIQELLTNTDPTNCDFDEYKADVEAARGGK
ncbi:hypothetical protein [Acinetobacter sp. 'aerobic (ED)']|uniref:hypothetical protein n=1 Tax=Acinetobacter sp. 'aerobic (ED)' TaxID=174230 RepID=UPI00192ADC5C|nr:hypothetical protein [Acinetobacter sp. 'aerobic (ED)']